MEWTENGSSFFLTDSAYEQDNAGIKFHIQPNRLVNGVSLVHSDSKLPHQLRGLEFYQRNGKIFLVLKSKKFKLPKKVYVDYLIVSNNALVSLKEIASQINFRELILDSSNSNYYCERLEKEAKVLGKSCFSVLRSGAFVLKL